ncbi:hypothetical protein DPMN_045097 [Dreissena polymorpha]|uniref:Uncharacterized protein n=1 Tax=Dreissena polymorpha TaxID=45954 RepID=A0A9D4D3P2_DREPO|nr:hypothetical protein DPMN_045097 [Dreissena polymorpha]
MFKQEGLKGTKKNAPPPDIIGINLLTKFHADRTINMASIVLIRKYATPPLGPYIIRMNLLTKFHEDRTINVASRVLTRQKLTPDEGRRLTDDGQKVITKAHHEHILLR